MAKALAHAGADIDFMLPYQAHHPDTEWMRIHAATNIHVTERNASTFAYTHSYQELREVQQGYINYVAQHVKQQRPDVIHAHDWLTMEAGVRAKEVCGAPLVVHVHATEFDRCGSSSGNPLIHEIEYHGMMMADRILAVSNITKNILVDKYAIPADKIEVVHNALDTDSLAAHEYDDGTYRYLEQLRQEGHTVVSTLTRFTVQKGLPFLMRAAARASEKYDRMAFLFAGDGEQRDELIEMAADLGISDKVFFTGFVRGARWRDAYSVSDVFVMSSVSEPFGISALEAAHHDAALIITKQSGVGEVLNSVFRYDFWDEDRLADQLVAVATSPALQSSLKHNIKSEYLRISWHDVAQKCMRAYTHKSQGVKV
jgi:glycosyltransferase involved in cell wall biosynthesis